MNNVSLQLQQYRALKAQTASLDSDNAAALLRHPEKTDFFRKLMQQWEGIYLKGRQSFLKVDKTF